jgi:WD40 repeat protein
VKLWALPGGKEHVLHTRHKGDVWAVAFSPDSTVLVSGDGDWDQPGDIQVQEAPGWHTRKRLAHSGEVLSLAFAPDGKMLAAGGWDRTIILWKMHRQSHRLRSSKGND